MKKFLNSFHRIDHPDDAILDHLLGYEYDKKFIKAYKKDISFLADHELIEILDTKNLPVRSYKAIISNHTDEMYFQGGKQNQFYILNEIDGFALNENTILDYIRSFFFCVYGTQGQLKLVEELDDFSWRELPPPSLLNILKDELFALKIHEMSPEIFIIMGCFVTNGALVHAEIHITPNGTLSINALHIIYDDLPVKSDFID